MASRVTTSVAVASSRSTPRRSATSKSASTPITPNARYSSSWFDTKRPVEETGEPLAHRVRVAEDVLEVDPQRRHVEQCLVDVEDEKLWLHDVGRVRTTAARAS